MAVKIQLRRDTAANWTSRNPILALGEPGVETDTHKLKFGDGSTLWNNLDYFAGGESIENIEDILGTSFLVAGSGIILNYSDSGNTLTISSSGVGGSVVLPVENVDLHNGGIQQAQVLRFDNGSYQSVITGAIPSSGNNAQRIIVQGPRGQGYGEGGDVYVWGGDSDTNGGDIKIYAGDADSAESGYGGYINIDAGNGYNQGGDISITAGNSTTQGGNVNISAGYPSGTLTISTNSGSTDWTFRSDATVGLPYNTLDAGNDSIDIKSSQYAELYFQSGPSGVANNYIENPTHNSESYIWTAYDGSYIQHIRTDDGVNPYWNHTWSFTNDGDLRLPQGRVINWGQNGATLAGPQGGGASDRIRLWDFEGTGSNFNYAIGVEPNHVWFTMDVNDGTGGFKFYSRSDEIFKISDDSRLIFPNNSTLAQGTFDNGTGGNNGISLNCTVGYELNWQGGHLKNTTDNGVTAANILCDSAIEFPGSGIDNVQIDHSGITFSDGTVQYSAIRNIFGGSGISVSSASGDYTISASGVVAGSAESIQTTCFNNTGATLSKGTVVYINGRNGNLPTVQKSIATNEAGSSKTYGIVFEDITDNHSGSVIVIGALTNFDTNQFSAAEGSTLYLSPSVSGVMTATKPSAPDHLVSVGKIVRNHSNQGIIQVIIQNGFELQELHNVAINGVTGGQFLQYNSVSQLWTPSSSGNFTTLQVNGTGVSVSGHTHTSANITDFTEAVQDVVGANGFLIGASGISVSYNDGSNTLTIAGGGGATVSNAADNRILTSDGTSTGINAESNLTFNGTTLAVSGVIDIDNLRLDSNTISSTNTNGNIVLAPNGTGDVQVDADTLRVGDSNSAATITTNGTGNLTLSTNAGTNSGSIVINQGSNGNIAITPNGTGQVDLSKVNIDGGSIDATSIGATSASTGKFTQLYPTVINGGSVSGSVGTDVSTGQIFDITVTGSTTLSNPTNPIDGVTIRWRILQDGTGSHTVSLDTKFVIPSSASNPLPWSTAANAMDILAATYHAGRDKWDIVAFVPGY